MYRLPHFIDNRLTGGSESFTTIILINYNYNIIIILINIFNKIISPSELINLKRIASYSDYWAVYRPAFL
jgi:hypothetical protein